MNSIKWFIFLTWTVPENVEVLDNLSESVVSVHEVKVKEEAPAEEELVEGAEEGAEKVRQPRRTLKPKRRASRLKPKRNKACVPDFRVGKPRSPLRIDAA